MNQVIKWIKTLLFSPTEQSREEVKLEADKAKLPEHVALIMDGNGRWARNQGLDRSAGHRAGVNTLKEIVNLAHQLGINCITAYAFSTENWKRPEKEVNFLMNLIEDTFAREVDNFRDKNIKVNVIGSQERLPESVQEKIATITEKTKHNDGLAVNIALNYGGRLEIIEAVKKISQAVKAGTLEVEQITEAELEDRLYTGGQPDPDLFIRTGGEQRISNFLLWQLAYTELYFTETYWPDFGRENFLQALKDYKNRDRRFGGLQEE